jgi:hypothetical protein
MDVVGLWRSLDADEQCVVLFALDALADGRLRPGPAWHRYCRVVRSLAPRISSGAMTPREVHDAGLGAGRDGRLDR